MNLPEKVLSPPLIPPSRLPWRVRLLVQLYKMKLWAQRAIFKKSLDLRSRCLILLDTEIRFVDDSLQQIGEFEDDDNLVEYVARQLTNRPGHPEANVADQGRIALAAELIARANKSQGVRHAIVSYYLAQAYAKYAVKEEQNASVLINQAKVLDPNVVALNDRSVQKRHADIKRRLRVANRELAERSAIKLDVSLADLSTLAGVVSVLFLCSGFLYTWFFFRFFGLDVSLFFSLTDYLATSLEQIRVAAYSAVLSLASFWFGIRDQSLRSRMQHRIEAPNRLRLVWFLRFIALGALLTCIWSIYRNEPRFDLMPTAAILCAYWFAGWLAPRFFKQRLKAEIAIACTLIFASLVGLSAYERAHKLLNGKPLAGSTTDVFLKGGAGAPNGPVPGKLIAANGSYIFLLQEDRRTLIALPKDRVETIKVQRGQ